MDTVFESKRDALIVVLIWAGALTCLYAAVVQFQLETTPLNAFMVLLFAAAAVVILWVLYGIRYTLTTERLLIRCGPLRYRVSLAAIDSVQPSRNPLSSPAASLDRLLIEWNDRRRKILISPTPKAEFLRELNARCPQLRVDGDGLTRAAG